MQLARLVAVVLITFILFGVIQIVISRSPVFAFLIGFARFGFIAVGLVLVGLRLLTVSFPVSGVDGMHESLHVLKSQGFMAVRLHKNYFGSPNIRGDVRYMSYSKILLQVSHKLVPKEKKLCVR